MEDNKDINANEQDLSGEEYTLDPVVEKLLDAKDYSDKIQCLELLRNSCDEHILSIIAISHDIELSEGTLDDKYAQVLKHFRMHQKYETSRLRN